MDARSWLFVSYFFLLLIWQLGQTATASEPHAHHCSQCTQHMQCETCPGVDRHPGRPGKPRHEKPGDINRGDCPPKRYLMNDFERAGNPHCVAHWARCSVTDKYSAWYVGGGAAFAKVPQLKHPLFSRGRPRKSVHYNQHAEGTWGLDYGGFFGKANIWLMYTCGRYQGGEGAYATDGEPKFVSRLKSLVHHE